ncbi:MAG TPA: hypothetical protein VKZ59_05520 [Acidobacteriota bacterium]|nr:hypothetical protein [Acidobacteriota bacterium]
MVDLNYQQISNRAIRTSDQGTISTMARWISVGGLFVALILSYAWINNEILSIQYEMEQLKRENTQLIEGNNAMRAELNALTNPDKIERVARGMGLISSNHAEVMILDVDQIKAAPSENLLAESRPQTSVLHE